MRTKLVLAAAILAAGLASSMAQNVYSLNVVGYVNQTVTANTWYMWGNPLNAVGTDNGTESVLTNLVSTAPSPQPNDWANSVVYGFVSGSYTAGDAYYPNYGWFPGNVAGGGADLTPGNGFFFYPATNGTVTFVGQVTTNNSFHLAGPAGWSLVSSAFPATNTLTAMGLIGVPNDVVYRFNKAAFGGYDQGTANYPSYGWYDGDPTAGPGDTTTAGPVLNVGEAVFYQNFSPTVTWTQNFTIQ
jgi:hypothetical protein